MKDTGVVGNEGVMLKVTLDYWPFGDASAAERLGTLTIVNEGTGTAEIGNYRVDLERPDDVDDAALDDGGIVPALLGARVEGHRRGSGAWALVARSIRTLWGVGRERRAPGRPPTIEEIEDERDAAIEEAHLAHMRVWMAYVAGRRDAGDTRPAPELLAGFDAFCERQGVGLVAARKMVGDPSGSAASSPVGARR